MQLSHQKPHFVLQLFDVKVILAVDLHQKIFLFLKFVSLHLEDEQLVDGPVQLADVKALDFVLLNQLRGLQRSSVTKTREQGLYMPLGFPEKE